MRPLPTAQELAALLMAKQVGSTWRCACPCCGGSENSFSIMEGDYCAITKCFRGCDKETVRSKLEFMGHWPPQKMPSRSHPKLRKNQDQGSRHATLPKHATPQQRDNIGAAKLIWNGALTLTPKTDNVNAAYL